MSFKKILIDDDKYVALNWRNKSNSNSFQFLHFESTALFFENLEKFEKKDYFFIDININGSNGYEVAKSIHDLGFKNIFFASGEDIDLTTIPYIVNNVGKQFPF